MSTGQKTGASSVEAAAGDAVRFIRFFHHFRVEPPCLDVLAGLQTAVRRLATAPGESSVLLPEKIAQFQLEDYFGTIAPLFFTGLEPAVRRLLERAGRKVQTIHIMERRNRTVGVVNPTPHHLPSPVTQTLFTMYILDQPLIDCIQRCELARIVYEPTRVDPASLVAQVVSAWPEKTILILAARRADVRRFRHRLLKYKVDADAVTGQNNPAEVGPVVVSTFSASAHAPIKHEWRDIVFVLGGVEAIGAKARWCLSHARRARWYALLPAGARPSPLEDDLLTELFGFDQIYIPEHFQYQAPVDVVRCSIEGGPSLPPGLSEVEVKRLGIWRHPVRNRRVAKAALLLREGRSDQLRVQIPAIPSGLTGMTPWSIFVIVENLEHGLALARKLPGWPLIAGPSPNTTGLSTEEVEIVVKGENARERGPRYAIVTAAGVQTLLKPAPAVVIRADGGVGLPVMGSIDRLLTNAYPGRRMLLIDFHDRHHPVLRRLSRQRQEAYQRRGWFAPGVDPVQARVDRFLAERPREECL